MFIFPFFQFITFVNSICCYLCLCILFIILGLFMFIYYAFIFLYILHAMHFNLQRRSVSRYVNICVFYACGNIEP